MECTQWREMASDYLEETLSPQLTQTMRAHEASCPTCGGDAQILRTLSRELNVLPTVDPPLFFADNTLARIERDHPRRAPWWSVVLPQMGRVAVGTLLTGGAAAALAWTLLLPQSAPGGDNTNTPAQAATHSPLLSLLPGSGADAARGTDAQPRLRISRATRMAVPGSSGPAYDLSFWLENADRGAARWQFAGNKTPYRFVLEGVAPQTVRVPFEAAQGGSSLALEVAWTADAAAHTRYLLLPVLETGDKAPANRQSFGLPDLTLAAAAQQIAARYGRPVTIDDVAAGDVRVTLNARDETAVQTLRRTLAPLNLRVSDSAAGILIEAAEKPADAKPAPVAP